MIFHLSSDTVLDAAETALETAKDAVETAAEAGSGSGGFNPMAFVENLRYMGVGMLGVFMIIGVIILATYAIGKFTQPKPNKKED